LHDKIREELVSGIVVCFGAFVWKNAKIVSADKQNAKDTVTAESHLKAELKTAAWGAIRPF